MSLDIAPHSHSQMSRSCLAAYYEWLCRQTLTPNTLRAYHSRIRQFLLFLQYSNFDCQSLASNAEKLDEAASLYVDYLKNSRTAASSVNACLSALNNFSQFLGFSQINIERQPCQTRSQKILSSSKQADFLRAAEKQESMRDRALASVLFHTGLRIGECANLNISDISGANSDEKTATSICLSHGARIELNEATANWLQHWLEQRQHHPAAETQEALWLTGDGKRLTAAGIAFVIRRIGWQARLLISVELLRRTWLVRTATAVMDKEDLAAQFGSYVSASTMSRYGLLMRLNPAAE